MGCKTEADARCNQPSGVSCMFGIQIFFKQIIQSVRVIHQGGVEAKNEVAGIRHNKLYSVNCVRIACSSENIRVLGSPQVFDERIS